MTLGNPPSEKEKEISSLLNSPLFSKGFGKGTEEEESFIRDFTEGTSEETTNLFTQVRENTLTSTELQIVKRIKDTSCKSFFPPKFFFKYI